MPQPTSELDLLTYGSPGNLGLDPARADRTFTHDIGRAIGFLDGRPGQWRTINGRIVPHVPMYMVAEGEVVVMRITNRSGEVQPMHLVEYLVILDKDDGVVRNVLGNSAPVDIDMAPIRQR